MFALHETTRKRVCRTAFFALCVCPTLLTAWWIASHYWPGRQGRISRELGRALDVHVKLADWREPRPRTLRTSGMTLSDGASGYPLVEVNVLEAQSGRGLQVYRIDEATIDAGQLDQVARKTDCWLRMLPPEVHEVRCRRLAFRLPSPTDGGSPVGPARHFEMHNVQVRIDRDAAGRVQAQGLAFVGDAQDATHAVRLTLSPSSDSGVANVITLQTESAGVAASAFAAVVPGFHCFGEDAAFVGKVQWLFNSGEKEGIVQGRVLHANLASVLPASSPHRLRGHATLELVELKWRAERIERLAGAVFAKEAAVSQSLVEAAVTNFRCGRGAAGQPTADDSSLIDVDYLGIHFNLNEKGLTFWGACPADVSREVECIAVSGMQPLLVAPRLHNWHVGWLVQTALAPPSGWLPATREAVEMADRLPLPVK
jgi:hypothetical protein